MRRFCCSSVLGQVGTAFVWVVACGCIVSGGMPGFGAFCWRVPDRGLHRLGQVGRTHSICCRFTRRGRYAFGAAYRLGTGGDRENVRRRCVGSKPCCSCRFYSALLLWGFNRGRCSTGPVGAVDEALAIVVVDEPAREQSTWSAPGRAHRYLRKVYWLR